MPEGGRLLAKKSAIDKARLQKRTKGGDKSRLKPSGQRRTSKSSGNANIHTRYSIQEDIEMLEYALSHPSEKYSSNFWKAALEDENILDGRRTLNSMRFRYRDYLKYLTKKDLDYMKEWVKKNGTKGEICVKKSKGKYSDGKLVPKIKLIILNTEERDNPDIDVAKTGKNIEPSYKDSDLRSVREKTKKRQDTKDEVITRTLNITLDPVEKNDSTKFDMSHKGRGKTQTTTADHDRLKSRQVRENPDYARNEEEIMGGPRKYVKPEKIIYNDSHDKGGSRVLSQVRNEVRPAREQLKDLLFYCSMNFTTLAKYLNGELEVLWHDDEDRMLMQPNNEVMISILSRFKGEKNVEERYQFLKNFEKSMKLFEERQNNVE